MRKRSVILLVAIVILVMTNVVFPASPGDVVINELMWMGSTLSWADEWIELRNTTGSSIDLSNWDITRYNGTEEELMLTIPAGKTIPAGGYFLISNYSSTNSKIDVTPDFVTTAVVLDNSKLQIKLYDGTWNGGGTLIDTADDGVGDPAAGDNDNKYSMVRGSAPGNYTPGDGTLASNWHTSDRSFGWDSGATERGTPANDNSLPITMSSFSAVASYGTIVLRWSTESEVETVGFHVLRSENQEGSYERISNEMILSQGNSSMGAEYEFVDRNVETDKGYWYKIEEVCMNGERVVLGPVYAFPKEGAFVPGECRLFNGYPNPFNPSVRIGYHVSDEAAGHFVAIKIYSLLGREVATLADRRHDPGEYTIEWDGCDADGIEVSSGIYFCWMLMGGRTVETKRMVKMR